MWSRGDMGLGRRMMPGVCLSGDKFGKAGWRLWRATSSQERTLGFIPMCLGRVDWVWVGEPEDRGTM